MHTHKTKNLVVFYTLTLNNPKMKLRKQFHCSNIKKNKLPRNKFNQGGEKICTLKITNIIERMNPK